MDRRKLSQPLRNALNAVRSAAAIYVVLYHLGQRHGGGPLMAPLRFGQEGVIVFFLLSGFVIFANERDRVLDLRGYYLRRLRRIYPVLIVAVVVAAAVAAADGKLVSGFVLQNVLGTLFSLADIPSLKPGVIAAPAYGNAPLWSLSYEVVFYLVFPAVMVLWRRSRAVAGHVVGVVAVSCYAVYLAAPNHFALVAAYFLMWWCGAAFADAYLEGGYGPRFVARELAWMLLLCLLAAAAVPLKGWNGVGVFPGLMLRHFAFALIALTLALTPLARVVCAVASRAPAAFAFVASISYGLYAFHYPLLVNWSKSDRPAGLALGLLVLVATAIVFDRRLDLLLRQRSRSSGSDAAETRSSAGS